MQALSQRCNIYNKPVQFDCLAKSNLMLCKRWRPTFHLELLTKARKIDKVCYFEKLFYILLATVT